MTWYAELDREYDELVGNREKIKMVIRSLDEQIADLDALLKIVEEDWGEPIIEQDKIWYAQLVNKTRLLKSKLEQQRKVLKDV
jgi:hypothetical protein